MKCFSIRLSLSSHSNTFKAAVLKWRASTEIHRNSEAYKFVLLLLLQECLIQIYMKNLHAVNSMQRVF